MRLGEVPSLGGAACEEPQGVGPWPHTPGRGERRWHRIRLQDLGFSVTPVAPGRPQVHGLGCPNQLRKINRTKLSLTLSLWHADYTPGLGDSNIDAVRNQGRSLLSSQRVTEATGIVPGVKGCQHHLLRASSIIRTAMKVG